MVYFFLHHIITLVKIKFASGEKIKFRVKNGFLKKEKKALRHFLSVGEIIGARLVSLLVLLKFFLDTNGF